MSLPPQGLRAEHISLPLFTIATGPEGRWEGARDLDVIKGSLGRPLQQEPALKVRKQGQHWGQFSKFLSAPKTLPKKAAE